MLYFHFTKEISFVRLFQNLDSSVKDAFMKLKRLEISGFKSFRDKTVIDFSKGVNAIVGPNGCGKSNVVDAIRWVMGEQRVKALRGKKMDDVIFNGSEDAAPVSMAEVVMTLSSDGSSFPGVYGELTEVSISRRAILDDENEYCINRVPAVCWISKSSSWERA